MYYQTPKELKPYIASLLESAFNRTTTYSVIVASTVAMRLPLIDDSIKIPVGYQELAKGSLQHLLDIYNIHVPVNLIEVLEYTKMIYFWRVRVSRGYTDKITPSTLSDTGFTSVLPAEAKYALNNIPSNTDINKEVRMCNRLVTFILDDPSSDAVRG